MQLSFLSALAVLSTAVSALAHPAPEPAQLEARTTGWAIKNFTRSSSSPTTAVTYTLVLDTYGTYTTCVFLDTDPNPWYHSFSDYPCSAATPGYHFSWGWNLPGNFTVMTVESFPARQKAWFGYNSPNTGLPGTVAYPDQGYNVPQ